MIVRGYVTGGVGNAQGWEGGLMALIRSRTQLPKLLPGTLNVEIENPHETIREDYKIAQEENRWRPEAVMFERCRLSREGISVRALIMRTSTNYWGKRTGGRTLEIMAEYPLRQLFSLVNGDEIQIELYDTTAEADAVMSL
jgi:CTP-dependent riboflavin kinase